MTDARQVRYFSNAEIAGELLDLDGRTALDVGCGEGRFTRILAARAKHVTGIDINQTSLDRAAAQTTEDGTQVTWRNAHAEDMPFGDDDFDVVVFSNSLHHVAPDQMDAAIGEAGRVLRRGGMLYVMEPVAAGEFFEATRQVNDETEVRDHAICAINGASSRGFAVLQEVTYHTKRAFDSFDEFADGQSRRSEKRRKIIEADRPGIRKSFIEAARQEGGKLWFDQIFRVNLLTYSG
jgi:2-polyprenyl-3-methyl-5-hydroxy-6-metoxy-1,4-benzoquinol methylase